ncbi:MAG: hypothetical protein ACOYLT_09980 [Flavobacterium sp.]|uniref:prenyltransferase/squalene oxidase repeat-containing protein n=1 Tax=Flavobacterium sp. TaxID=239 RepID=UPI003BCFFDA7
MEALNIAGFLCYKAIVLRDDYIDKINPDNIDIEKVAISRIFLNQAKKILLELFSEESTFWVFWQKRNLELDSTEELDKLYQLENIDREQYETFASNKSAFAKLAIDGLHVLSQEKNKEAHNALTKSHSEFSIAMQLFDDLFDVEEDFKNKQFNLAIHNVRKFLKENSLDEVLRDSNEIEKHLFLSGIANEMLQKALLHLENSEFFAKDFKVTKWIEVINFNRKIFKGVLNQKEVYLEIIKAKVRHSEIKANNFIDGHNLAPSIHKSIQKGIDFIVKKQRTDGSWFEYLSSAGASDIWATGFITFFCNNIIPKDNIQKAKNILLKDAHPLWGYKQSYLNDTDSSNFALLGLEAAPKSKFDRLVQRQNIDGGFPTYAEKEIKELRKYMKYPKESKYIGWTQSHLCVSAVTYYLLLCNKNYIEEDYIKKIEAFLVENLNSKNEIAYWWTNETYSLFWLSLAFRQINNFELKNIIKTKLVSSVNNYKPFLNPDTNNTRSIFYTALQLNICIALKSLNIINSKTLILDLVKELLSEQYMDGSWNATNAMRLPDTEVLNPLEIREWPASEQGCNVRAIEFNRLFTTAVTINSLNSFLNLYPK